MKARVVPTAMPDEATAAVVPARRNPLSPKKLLLCARRPNFDHPCRLNADQGWKAAS